jgi:tyrosyl-tRNA synthetase
VVTIKYAAGRQVLILIGDKTVTYNDLLGRSFDVPILSRTKIAASAQRQ